MNFKRSISIAMTLALLLIAGCAAHMRNPKEQTRSLAYGYIDMSEAPTEADVVIIRQHQPNPDNNNPYRKAKGVSGVFWFDQLAPGSYQIAGFRGDSFWRGEYEYFLPELKKNDTQFTINTPGLYFIGPFKFNNKGSYFNLKFDVMKTDTPSEWELLGRLLPYSEGTQWEKMIRQRMQELKK